ncbi:MAG: hypothetical protein N2746_00770 [Deltaproteobacteria bacterium]|nr:hypothetical protein [Deltaproteobacteria bacterium]
MRLLLSLSIITILSCLSTLEDDDFFISDLIPKSGEFEDRLTVSIKFSKPINKDRLSMSDIVLQDTHDMDSFVEISSLDVNPAGDMITIYAENVEPEREYRIIVKGKVLSEDNKLLLYHYNGDFISDGYYSIKRKNDSEVCIVINEVLNFPSEKFDQEFIEIYNCSNEEVDLRGYYIKVDDNKPQKLLFKNNAFKLPKASPRIILSNAENSTTEPIVHVAGKFGKNGLSNTSLKHIQIFNERGKILDEFKPFAKTKKGISFERINPHLNINENNWGYSISEKGCTPNNQNSIFMKDIFPPKVISTIAKEADFNIKVFIQFDEDILCENPNCIYLLSEGNEKIHGISSNISGKDMLFIPYSRIKYSTNYEIVATPSLTDVYGNSYSTDSKIGRFKTPNIPPIQLYYPSTYDIPSNIRYLEFISKDFEMNREKIILKGGIQELSMICIRSSEDGRYLCSTNDHLEGPEKMCLFINHYDTNICINFLEPEEVTPPLLTTKNFLQIKDQVYIEADSSVPCVLFVDFIYKEDLDETFSYSSYSFMQHFEYKTRIQDPYKQYFVEVYCVDLFNNSSERLRFETHPVQSDEPSIIISEVLPNPIGSDNTGEFIEIFNSGNKRIQATQIQIGDCTDTIVKITKMSKNYLDPGEPAVIVSNHSTFFNGGQECLTISGADKVIGRELKNSSPETLCLYYNGLLLDYYNPRITTTKEGQSIKRVNKDIYFESSNWTVSSIPGGTPCFIH